MKYSTLFNISLTLSMVSMVGSRCYSLPLTAFEGCLKAQAQAMQYTVHNHNKKVFKDLVLASQRDNFLHPKQENYHKSNVYFAHKNFKEKNIKKVASTYTIKQANNNFIYGKEKE